MPNIEMYTKKSFGKGKRPFEIITTKNGKKVKRYL